MNHRTRAGRGQPPGDPAPSPNGTAHSAEICSVPQTDETAAAVCVDKKGLARFLGFSVRSLDRAAAMGLLPRPDLTIGKSPRWSPDTIKKWLRTRPKLPGRGRRGS